MENRMKEIVSFKSILRSILQYEACGCDACHWEAYDFKYFYWFKDWDVENPKLKFGIRLVK